MGTRSLTRAYETDGKPLTCIYQQFDGYPTGVGLNLARILGPFSTGNGIRGNEKQPYANGAGCLAAQLVALLKQDDGKPGVFSAGGVYVCPPRTVDAGEEYEYRVRVDDGASRVHLEILSVGGGYAGKPRKLKSLWKGLALAFNQETAEELERGA